MTWSVWPRKTRDRTNVGLEYATPHQSAVRCGTMKGCHRYVSGECGDYITAWFNWHLGDWKYVILDDDDDMGVTLI